jgi:5-methylcytosine-specific restriction endonuclease McrA
MSEQAKQAKTTAKQKEANSKAKNVAKQGIKQVSKKQQSINAELAKIKKELLAENPICFSSGETSNLTLSHIIPRTCKAFATYKPNLVLENFEVHQIFEHNKRLYKELYPFAWLDKLERVKQMCNTEYQKLKAKGEQD